MIRFLATGVAVLFLVVGSLAVLAMAIVGGFQAFTEGRYVALFVVTVVWVYGTAWLAFRVARHPTRAGAMVLAALVLPALVFYAQTWRGSRHRRDLVRIYVQSPDPAAAARARAELLTRKQRAGSQPEVNELLRQLSRAGDDSTRIRIVALLGALSYQYQPALTALRRLREETRGDPTRAALHAALGDAIRRVNPYEGE